MKIRIVLDRSRRSWSFSSVGVTLLLTLILAAPALAQQRWQRAYGEADRAVNGYSVQPTPDSGYIVAGASCDTLDVESVYLIKTDKWGQMLWTKQYFGEGSAGASYVQLTSDGGYIVVGSTVLSDTIGDYDLYLIKTDAQGDTVWTRTYGDTSENWGSSVQQTSDGGYIVTGFRGFRDRSMWLIKTNSSGDSLWTRTYGVDGDIYSEGWSVRQTSDSGYVVAGYRKTPDGGVGSHHAYLVKTNTLGDTLWTRTYTDTGYDDAYSVRQTSDGGYIVAGLINSFVTGNYDVFLIRTDGAGNSRWERTYGGVEDDRSFDVQQTPDGGFIVAGGTSSFGAGSEDVYLVRTDTAGDTLWTRTYGGTGVDEARAIQRTLDGGFIVGGATRSFGGYFNPEVYLIKTDSLGNTAPYSIVERQGASPQTRPSLSLSAYPTLFSRSTTLDCVLPVDAKSARLEIRDITGRLVRTESPLTPALSPKGRGNEGRLTWDGTDSNGWRLPSGCYFCTLRTGTLAATARVILTR